jgi:hypothetical protein
MIHPLANIVFEAVGLISLAALAATAGPSWSKIRQALRFRR